VVASCDYRKLVVIVKLIQIAPEIANRSCVLFAKTAKNYEN